MSLAGIIRLGANTGGPFAGGTGKRDVCDASDDTISSVRSRFLRVVIALILLACFACPIFEMRDRWDHTLKTGQDTESTFVVLAVCAGVIISFALRAATLDPLNGSEEKGAYASFAPVFEPLMIPREFAAVSQPPPALRI